MGFRKAVFAVLILTFSIALTAKAGRQLFTTVEGRITISSDGSVKNLMLYHYKIDDDIVDIIKAWKFEPIQMGGIPSEVTVPVSFSLISTLADGKKTHSIEFSDLYFGLTDFEEKNNKNNDVKVSKQPPIRFPSNIRADLSGTIGAVVEVAVDISPNGTVKNTAVYSIGVINTDARTAKIHSREFAREATAAISRFRWTADELEYNDCQNGCVRLIRVDFRYNDAKVWQPYISVDVKPVSWAAASELNSMDQPDQSQIVRLKDDPSGKPIDLGG